MKQRTTDKARLVSGMRAVLGRPINDEAARLRDIDLLEKLASATQRAGEALRRVAEAPMMGVEGTVHRWITPAESKARMLAYAERDREALQQHLNELRTLTGDDDAAWAQRLARIGVWGTDCGSR